METFSICFQSINPKNIRNLPVYRNFHEIYSSHPDKSSPSFEYDMKNTMTFIQSQRMYKTLLDRYNPLIDLTGEERIEATARRVGLNMPILSKGYEE
ncbi:hypothetical protein OF83DRAFT_1059922 [Amylostereum chailletii]|nr:hypothetical protein OF83DRAFT_1059922 [Amylostereum chailletii]